MEDPSLASLWLPAAPPGMCKQGALGERTCVQVRNRLEMGAPPPKSKGGTPKASHAATTPVGLAGGADEWAAAPSEPPALDVRAFI